jgi:chorismate dehydratase
MTRLRVAAISYLNTAPLMWDFDHGSLGRKYEVEYMLPAVCAEKLSKGEADIGIIPAAAYATIPDLQIIPDVAIASRGPVRSILLVSKKPISEIKIVALDTSSRSSVALMKVLFAKCYGTTPEFAPAAPKLDDMLAKSDAALLIGDPALTANTEGYEVHDLGAEWTRFTGRPFVFAFWAVRKAANAGTDVARDFEWSRRHGVLDENIASIAELWSPILKLEEKSIASYLTDNIHYRLDAACLEGLRLFFKYAEECGALPKAPELSFLA